MQSSMYARLVRDASGSLTVNAHAAGPWRSPEATAHVNFQGFHYGDIDIDNLDAHIEHKPKSSEPLALEVAASSIAWNSTSGRPRKFPIAKLTWVGNFKQGDLDNT